MSDDRYVVIITPDQDFDPGNFSDDQSVIDETVDKINTGEWAVYGVGLGHESLTGDIEPDYGTFVWGTIAAAGHEGIYLGVDKVQDTYLREQAGEQIAEYGETEHQV